MEQLSEKILKADFSAKKNLIHNIRARRYSLALFVAPGFIYGLCTLLNPKGRNHYMQEFAGAKPSNMYSRYMTGKPLEVRRSLRPEIYFLEKNMKEREFMNYISDNVDFSKTSYKPFVWN